MRNFEQVLRLEPGRTALLVVDMQRGFVDPGEALEVPQAREIVPVIQRLLAVFQSRRLPVVFTGVRLLRARPAAGRRSPSRAQAGPARRAHRIRAAVLELPGGTSERRHDPGAGAPAR